MNMRDLMSWTRGSDQPPDFYREGMGGLTALQRQMNRLLEDAFRGFDAPALFGGRHGLANMAWPKIEVNETEKDILISAEIPGLEEKDVELLLNEGNLIIRGEKKAEIEDKDRQFSERFYGRFERRISLGLDIEEDKVEASFRNGLLKVTLPKTAPAQSKMKRIEINGPTKH
ncbi:MAG: Hsp20/alpha crystallin family protein [Methylocella sp.]